MVMLTILFITVSLLDEFKFRDMFSELENIYGPTILKLQGNNQKIDAMY